MNGPNKDQTGNPVIESKPRFCFKQCSRFSRCKAADASQYAGRSFRNVMTGLAVVLVAAGFSAEVKAQVAAATVSPNFVCQGETEDLVISGIAPFEVVQYLVSSSGAGVRGTAWRALNSDGTVNSSNTIINLSGLTGTFTTTLRIQNISADGSVVLTAYNASPITINFHPSSHASCASTTTDGVTLSESALTLTELGSSSDVEKTYTVVLDTDPGANVVVTVSSNDTTAVAVDTDSSTAGDQDTLTFTTSNWNAAQTVTLRALNDGDAAAETVTISHSAAVTDTNNPYHGIEIGNVTATTVDASHGVIVSKTSVTVDENSDTETYTIKLKSQPGGSVVITPTSGATARATVSGALTFTNSNWSSPQTVTVTGASAGSATISHAVTTGTTAYPASTTTITSVGVTINAVAAEPELTFDSATYSVAENGGTIDITVNADTAPSSALTVNLSTTDGTTTGDGFDFATPASTFTFPASMTSHTITVNITNDLFLENDETFTLTLDIGTGYTVGTQASTTVTINDEDSVTIELAESSYTVLEDDTLNVVVTFTSNPSSADIPITFTLTPTDGTATGNSNGTGAGIDYDNDAVNAILGAGAGSTGITFAINDDTDQEVDETFTLALSTTQARVSVGTRSQATVTIADNDRAQGLVFTPAVVTVDEGASATYTVRPTTAPSSEVMVSVTVPGSTDLSIDTNPGMAGTQTTALTFTTSNWHIGQPIEVIAAQDVDAVDDMVTLTHSPTGGGYSSTHDADLVVTIDDDETAAAVPVISMSLPTGEIDNRSGDDEQIHEENGGTTGVLLSVSADRMLASALTVCISITEDSGDRVASGDEGIKTVSLTSSGNSNGSGTRNLTWTDTNTDDQDSSVTVEVIAPNTNGCSATAGSYTVSTTDSSDKLLIKDDEATAVELTSSDNTMTEGIASATATVTVELSRRLYEGEVVVVPLTFASSTGARLPGSTNSGTANHDFTVSAAPASGNSNAAIANEGTATPTLTFTGDNTDTVQGAIVTLTPVAGRSDGDSTDETITVTLASDSVLGATGTGTTVSGGAQRHASNYMASLTLAEPGTPGITLSTAGPLRLLETGSTTYTVVLDAAPTADVRVIITPSSGGLPNGDIGAAGRSPTELTFTTSDWSQPQTVTVTGSDESATHRNRALWLTHGVLSTDTRYGALPNTSLRVNVDDAPELEAYWYIKGGGAGNPRIQRPHTITSTRGLTAWQNAAPGDRINYAVRLSNRPGPDTGGTVTVTATVPSDKRNLVGLSLTESGTAQDTVTVEFKDRSPGAGTGCSNWFGHQAHQYFDSHGYTRTVSGRQPGESYDGTPDTPWECWRMIYVVRKDASRNIDDTCVDITHTATGGGVRKVTVDTIRAHVRNPGRNRRGSRGYNSQCPNLTGNTLSPQGSPAKAAPTPTEAVANVQVTPVDDTSASVTWDAVEHATSYDVSWSAESSDALNASAGDLPGITGTTATIDHGASVPMTLTVTVIPEYIDENGDTVQLDDLGTTATLEVGPGSDALRAEAQSPDTQSTQSAVTTVQRLEAAKLCVSDTLMEKTKRYYELHRNKAPGYGANWFAILTAFGKRTQADWTADSRSIEPMSSASSRERESKWSGWKPFTEALECVETELAKVQAAAQAEAQAAEQKAEQEAEQADEVAPLVLPDDLTVTLESADSASGVTEGTQVSFTLKADTAPTKELEVTVTVTQTGDVASASATGERKVTIPVGQTQAAFKVATIADDTDEVQGSLTATVSDGTGYKTEDQSASVTVAVNDDDATSITLSASADDLTETFSEDSSEKTLTVTLGRTLIDGESIEVPLVFTGTASLGSDYTLEAPKTLPTGVSYANLGGSDPAKAPTVTFAGSTGGVSSLTATLTLTTVADSTAEDDKETVTVKLGTPATTGLGGGVSTSGNVQFSILEPVPQISITAKTQSVAEGTDAVFTVTANRSLGSDLSVNLTVSESEGSDFVAADNQGTAKVTITKGETEADFSVPTVNDSVNEPDGSITVTVVEDGEKGQYYSQASSPGDSASIKITDNDAVATGPEFSVADETANENVGLMYFTVRLNRSLSQKVQVTFNVRESSPVSARMGQDYFWWWEDGLALTFYPGQTQKKMWVYVYNDNHDEDPETFEVVLSNPTGATAIGDGVAVGTIVNSDPMPAAWLSRFGRTAAQQALDGIAARIESSRTSGIEGSIAGQALVFDPKSKSLVTNGDGKVSTAQNSTANSLTETSSLASFDAQHAFGDTKDASGNTDAFGYQSYSMTEREALLASSFTATEDKDTSGGSLAFWGQASQSNFDGTEGTFSLDGEATTLMSGTDYARGEWLLGIALMQSKGKGGYRDTDTVKQADLPQCKEESDTTLSEDARKVLCNGAILKGSGDVEATLTAAVPYASFDATERLKVWGALGLGTGDVTLKPNVGGKLSSDISWTMAAGGMRGDVISQGSGFSLAIKSDVLWARTTSDKTNQLAASDSKVTRLRFGLEGAWTMALDGNGTVTPKLEAGMRHDGGDAESGFGVELGGSVVWTDPTIGMSLDVSGRTLVTHDDDDLKDSGFAASLIWDPKPTTARGASFTVNLDRGAQAKGGMDALFTPQTIDRRSGTTATSGRWRAQAAYGVAAPGGRYVSSPYMGLGLGAGTREYTLGWKSRLSPMHRMCLLGFAPRVLNPIRLLRIMMCGLRRLPAGRGK